jgi:AbrB family looped-hinge helix DNA binding protein
MDKAGRVVLPKPVRDRLGLHEGSALEIMETPEGVIPKPTERHPSMVKKQGLWVHTGKQLAGFDYPAAQSGMIAKTASANWRACEGLTDTNILVSRLRSN